MGTIEVFYSYSHKDEALRDELNKHLTLLKRQGTIRDWHDRNITGGQEWSGQIDQHLNSAGVILLLVSADFVASDYCWDVEVKRALERHEAGDAVVIPIILRAVDWRSAPFGKLQGFPKDGKPVTSWANQDEAFADIAKGIRRAVEQLATTPAGPAQATEPSERSLPNRRSASAASPPRKKRLPSDPSSAEPSPTALDWYNRGLRFLHDEDYNAALDALNQAIELDPALAWAYYNRGLAHYFQGNDDPAIRDFDRVVDAGLHEAVVFRNRANAFSRKGDVARALADYAQAIALEPENPLAYLNRGEVHENTLQKAKAIADYKAVLNLVAEREIHDTARARLRALGVRPVAREDSAALGLWQKKLAFLQVEEARAADADQKFSIQQRIEEARTKIQELGG